MLPLVQIKNVSISFNSDGVQTEVVKDISFDIDPGKITAVIGESGSGKSVTALSFMQLLPKNATVKGELLYSENGSTQTNLATLSQEEIRKLRGNRIAMIFQEPMTSLNPVHTCGAQVMESLMLHKKLSRQQAKEQAITLFEKVELPVPEKMLGRYPHEISGGQKQRVMIAMAMSCDPALLIADEPTTALDVRVQKSILDLLKKLQQQNNMAVLLITHDLSLVADVADEIVVMYKGEIAEKGNAATILKSPAHAYTQALLACKPKAGSKGKRLPLVSEFLSGEIKEAAPKPETASADPKQEILRVENLKVYFPDRKSFFGKVLSEYKAVDDVSFTINKNETIGLVGESGCGKTTLGRAILQLVKPTSGKIFFEGKDLTSYSPEALRILRKDLQIVFQDPYGSLNPTMTIGDAITEPIKVHFPEKGKKERREQAVHLLEQVSLTGDILNRHPHSFSGGQRQRICIARALALDPDFLIFDESVSALDVSVQAQVLNLINDLKAQYSFTSIFISHDLAVVHYISDRIIVMKAGKIEEEGMADEVFFSPKADYTQKLIAAIPGSKLVL
jgi:peptide/nickel transport system ATP-binding protein